MDPYEERSSPFRRVAATARVAECGEIGFAETLHRPGARTGRHTHDRPRLCLVLAGRYRETLDRGEWQRCPGTLVFYPAGVPHDDRFDDEGAHCFNIRLSRADLQPCAYARGPGARGAGRRDEEPSDGVTGCGVRTVETAYRIYDGFRAGEGDALRRPIRTLLALLTAEAASAEAARSDRVTEARDLVEAEATRGIGLGAVASAVGMDRFALARAFRERFGCSLGEYRHRILVRRAREALLSTDDSLSAIAYRTGFADQSHFTRVFRRHTGLPPGRYRGLGA